MNILYSITTLIIGILFVLIQKTEKKQNILLWLTVTIVLTLCYNILSCLMCTFIGIMCTLRNLSICNIIIIGIISGMLLKNKKIQKYYLNKSDLIYLAFLCILVIVIAYKQYGIPFNIKYGITDGSTHYYFAQQFSENETLLYNGSKDDVLGIYNSEFRLPGAYVNEGILFNIFEGILHPIDIFIMFDLFILFLSGMLYYYLLKRYAKENKKMKYLAIVFSIMYILGYQLSSMLIGYVYLSLALDIIICFLIIMDKHGKNEIDLKIALIILSLLSFGMFFSYAFFIPIIYISIVINLIIKSKLKNKNILCQYNIVEFIYVIIIPAILGIFYFIIFPIIQGRKTEISTIGVEGDIYKNFITNYLVLIPIFIISIIVERKNKKCRENNYYQSILFIMAIIFAIVLFIGNKLEIVSEYYFFKSYYIIWILAIYNAYIALSNILATKNKKIERMVYLYIVISGILVTMSTFIWNKNIAINDIFCKNIEEIQNENKVLKRGEIEILKQIEKKISYDDLYVLNPKKFGKSQWMSVLYHNQYIYIDCMTGYDATIERWLTEKEEKYYLAYYEEYNMLNEEQKTLNENSSEYKIIYNNEYGFVLEKNKEWSK